MTDIVNDSGCYVELTQRYTCYVCGAIHEATAQLRPEQAAFWNYPSGWMRVNSWALICGEHNIRLEVDGNLLPDFTEARCFPRKVEGSTT